MSLMLGLGLSALSWSRWVKSRRSRRRRRRRQSRQSSKHRLQHKGVSAKLRIGRDELSSAQNKTRGSYTRASCLPRAIRPSKLLAPRGLIGRRGGRPAVCGPLQPRCTPAPVQPSPTQSNPVQPTSSGDLPSNLQSPVLPSSNLPRLTPDHDHNHNAAPCPHTHLPAAHALHTHSTARGTHPRPFGATCRLEASRRITRCTPEVLPTILVVRTCPSSPPRVLPCNTPASLCLHPHSCRHSLTQTRRRHSTPAHRISTPPYSRCWHPCCCPAHPPQWAHLPAWWALYSRPQATC
jgi:hypothetical protein